jgi:Bacterial Ig-like domain (group 3)
MTSLTSSTNPSAYGQAVTFTAVVTSSMGAPPDGETVRFMKGTTVLGTGALSGGSATFTTSTFPVGANYIKAVYGGDSKFVVSTSITVKQVVKKAATATSLSSSPTVHVWAGGDLYRSGHFQARLASRWRSRHV